MSVRTRRQRSYDHRLKELVRSAGDPSVAIELGFPRSTAVGWLRPPMTEVVTTGVLSETEAELRGEVIELRRRLGKLLALLRLLLAVLKVSGFELAKERPPVGEN